MWGYEKRLGADLARWRQAGWVSADAERLILADVQAGRSKAGLAGALAVLGAVLLGFAAMSFVAANWQDMSKALRLGLLFAGLAGSYAAAGALFARRMEAFGHAAVLTGVGLFGASIMLIAQMYHMDGNPPDAVLTWAAGALLAGAAFRSNPALAAAMLLVALWGGWETVQSQTTFWPFVAGWAVVAAAFWWMRWVPGLHLAAVVLSIWIVTLGYTLNKGHAHELVVLIGAVIAGGALVVSQQRTALGEAATPLIGYGAAIAFAGLWAKQFFETTPVVTLIVLACIALAMCLALIFWGWRTGNRGLLWLGYAGFSMEILAIYFKTIGTLMGSSAFFFTIGLIVIGLAALAWRLNQRLAPSQEVQS